MNYTEEITFANTGLDQDSERKFIAKGDTDFRLNLVINGEGKHGVLTSIRGNRLINSVDYGLSDSQDHTIIGDCYDAKRNVKYLFDYGSQGSHSILKYNYSTESLSFFLEANDKIGLDINYLITDACVIGDTLFFNPRSSSPRAINIPMLDNYNTYPEIVSGTSYGEGTLRAVKGKIVEIITTATGAEVLADVLAGEGIKSRFTGDVAYYTTDLYFYNYAPQPTTAPDFLSGFTTDTTKLTNNLSKSIFQFCYRYIYLDNSRSITSPYSIAAVPVVSEEAYGAGVNSNTDNKLEVTVYYPATTLADFESLAYVELFFRQSDATGWGVWKLADRVDWRLLISPTTEYTIDFYNDKSFPVADQLEIARAYSALPKLANAQASLMNDRISYGGITEGFDNVNPIVTLTPEFNETPIITSSSVFGTYTVTEEVLGEDSYRYTIDMPASPPDNGKIFAYTRNGVRYDYTVTGSPDTAQFRSDIITFLSLCGVPHVEAFNDAYGDIFQDFTSPRVITVVIYNAGTNASFYKRQGFKTGADHRFCIFYYDELMRRSGAMINDGLKVYLPFITEQSISNPFYIYNYTINWAVSNPPPAGAKYWRFGYAGNTTLTYFIQYVIGAYTAGSPYDSINISPLQVDLLTTYPHTNIEPYVFEAGDRVRFITPPSSSTKLDPYAVYYDFEIIEQSGTGAAEVIKIRTPTSTPSPTMNTGSVIEIYRPQKTDTITYYEYGALYDVLEDGDGNLYHQGETNDQSLISLEDATGVFTIGDIYHVTRSLVFPSTLLDELYPVESMWASDFYDSQVWGQGKVGYVDNTGEVTLNNIRYSDPYLQDTKINGLSSFQYLNYVSVNNKYGKITGMYEVGYTLRVYLETNSLSIPVGRTAYTDAQGNDTVVVSDQILGTQRIDTDGFGTVFPESLCRVGNAVYFFDSRKGHFIRDSLNGAISIDNKMGKYFKDKMIAIREKGEADFKVLVGWDGYKDLVIVSFNDSDNGSEDSMLAFHEPSNRWVTYLLESPVTISNTADMPSWLSAQGELFMSYLWGDTYVHDVEAYFCKFYGIQYGIENRVYSSDANNLNKLYEAIAVHSNQRLDLDTIYVYTDETNEGYMLSKIPDSWWKKIEGTFRSPYLRNMLTNGVSSIKDLFNGDFLRGKVIENRLTKDSVTSELNIFKIELTTEKSNV